MRDILDDIDRWRDKGRRVAVARVVNIEGSGPRDPGAAMAVSEDGEVAGSVSGGCVEGAVVSEALGILHGDRPATSGHVRLQRRRGLRRRPHLRRHDSPVHRTAGLVTMAMSVYEQLRDRIRNDEPVGLCTIDRRSQRRRQAADHSRSTGAGHPR